MKKVINNKEVDIDINFLSECLRGKIISKITLSNINDIESVPKKILDIIKKYKEIYEDLNFLIKYNESSIKYCLIGELMGVNYSVENNSLSVKIDNSTSVNFKSEYWSLHRGKSKSSGITWKDCLKLQNYKYFNSYITDPDNFIRNNFYELYLAYNKQEKAIERDLESLLKFSDIKPLKLESGEILDTSTLKRFKLFCYFAGTVKGNDEKLLIDLNNSKTSKIKSRDLYKFSIYAQNLIEGDSGTKDFSNMKPSDDKRFNTIIETLSKNKEKTTRGIIINDDIYYEVGNDIYQANSHTDEKIIQNGKIYGIKNNKLLIKNSKIYDEKIIQDNIYILDNDYLDIIALEINEINS